MPRILMIYAQHHATGHLPGHPRGGDRDTQLYHQLSRRGRLGGQTISRRPATNLLCHP